LFFETSLLHIMPELTDELIPSRMYNYVRSRRRGQARWFDGTS
jgi:hypothetical protein